MPGPVSVVIFAPGGCADADECLRRVEEQAGAGDEVLVVVPTGFPVPCGRAGHEATRHVAVASQDIFDLRLASVRAARHARVLLLEEHGLPGPGLVEQVREAFTSTPDLVALTFFSVNGTGARLGGRLLYAWIFHGTEVSSRREQPSPVCSTFAIDTERLQRLRGVDVRVVDSGELELRIVRQEVARAWPAGFRGAIEHHEDLPYRDTIEAVFASSRMTGAHDTGVGPARALGRALRRNAGNWRAAVRDGALDLSSAAALAPVAAVGVAGELTGRWLGVGQAPAVLARHHPAAAGDPHG